MNSSKHLNCLGNITALYVVEPRVLIVASDAIIGFDLEQILNDFGCSIVANVTNAADAGAFAERDDVDLAFIDYDMRDESCQRLATLLDGNGIEFVSCTGVTTVDLSNRYQAQCAITKPFQIETIRQIVELKAAEIRASLKENEGLESIGDDPTIGF